MIMTTTTTTTSNPTLIYRYELSWSDKNAAAPLVDNFNRTRLAGAVGPTGEWHDSVEVALYANGDQIAVEVCVDGANVTDPAVIEWWISDRVIANMGSTIAASQSNVDTARYLARLIQFRNNAIGLKRDEAKLHLSLLPPVAASLFGVRHDATITISDIIKPALLIAWADGPEAVSQALHDTASKIVASYVEPAAALTDAARVMMVGAKKYNPANWRTVRPSRRYIDAMLRHLFAATTDRHDDETGLPHIAHALCCVLFLLTHYDDDPTHIQDHHDYFGSPSR